MRKESGLARRLGLRSRFGEGGSLGEGGQTLVEVLLALGIAVVIITAITAVVISALDNAQFTRNQSLANAYAQEGMEVVRGIKDRSWNNFWNLSGGPNFCLKQNSTELVSRNPGSNCEGANKGEILVGGIKFLREITINNNDSRCKQGPPLPSSKVTVGVSWHDSRCKVVPNKEFCHKAITISCFVKLNIVPTP